MIKWALLGWLSSSLTDQLIRLISSRANWQSLHHHHSYKQTSEAQVNQVIFNRSPPPFLKWTSPFKSVSGVFVFLHPNWNTRAPSVVSVTNMRYVPTPFLKWTCLFKSISHVFVFLHPNWNKRALIELEASRSHNWANIQFAFFLIFWFLLLRISAPQIFLFRFGGFKGDVCKSLFRIKMDERFLIYPFRRLHC